MKLLIRIQIFLIFAVSLMAFGERLEEWHPYPLITVIVVFAVLLTLLLRSYNRALAGRKKSQSGYDLLFENSPDGLLYIDRFTTIHKSNGAFAKLVGHSTKDLYLNNIYGLSPDIQPETGFFSDIALNMFIENAIKGNPQRFEWYLQKSDDQEIAIEVLLTKLNGESDQLLFIARDIQEIKRLQQEKGFQQAVLIQQSKLAELGNMIGAIAHQWKQPLNAIGIIAQDLPEAYEFGELNKEEVEKISSNILDQVKFMSQTIDDFRNFYKPSKEAAPFEVMRSIRGVTNLLKTQLIKHNIELNISGDDAIKAVGYESEFRQVVLNLITNVKDVVDDQSLASCKIDIEIKKADQKVLITVQDNAGGIPAKLLPTKIFEPFVSTKQDKGTGIGLSLAKTIIEDKMHGKIYAINTNDGALFTIELVASKES